ncbi:MAG: cation diffusion facilitator family transporter [Bacillota bacterium]|uniref:cation diffusion facilitator family transporter n=1 Tax=Fictibacillus TaxID=1329200 RepID=UPI0018CF1F27|nr:MULTISPECIES: cation diffusion facilitator family transporter [unclassified Fictibacillus]MBH0157160.1 cation transporter [Fictibacillus sp. 5RED26]MBH0159481.1 cation transporter [Fictibacillus sp. 26RED30]MBH0163720.1 cation transporter [Fictibacillus sp. 7GRE50]MBH0169654.1 cation transporter [Fictibacillus sp. 18YEL24]MBH0174154.1 cation transporter [Fictibacillus sp. 23RED33]
MGHSHDHGHHHHGSNNKNALKWSFFLIASFMIVEVIGGLWTNSLALLSDAGHMLSDAAALGLSFLALTMGQRKATHSKTFGYKRFEILAAFLNGITLILISLYIFWEAYHRIVDPPEVVSSGMLIISFIGLLVNIAAAYILMKGDKDENLNVRSAFLHVLGDMLGSVGAIVAALLIMFLGWSIADPIASIIVAVLIIISGWRVTKDSFHILMEGTPLNLDVEKVKEVILSLPEVKGVNDLHVWSITSDFPALSCHVVKETSADYKEVLNQVKKVLHDEFHIHHTTIEVDEEREGHQHQGHCN